MRKDMARVIVERPRHGPMMNRKGRNGKLEDLPAHEGMRRPHVLRRNEKDFSDYLSPLRRYLARQVGRPWRKVFAEITVHLRVDSTTQQHLRDHLRDFVAVTPQLRYGQLWWHEFYVDPRTDLLCRTDRHPLAKTARRSAQNAAKSGTS